MAINLSDDYIKTDHKYIYKHRTNNTYLVRFYINDKIYNKRNKITKSGFKTISETQDFIAEMRIKYKNKENKNNDTITFKEAFEEYINDCKLEVKKGNLSDSTINSKQTIFKNQILPKLGKVIITNVTEKTIRVFQEDLLDVENKRVKGQILSNGTVTKIHKQLSAFLNSCVRKRLIPYNPASIVGNVKKEKVEKEFLTIQEFKELISVVNNMRDYFILVLLFNTGLRIGEMLGLTKDSIITTESGTLLKVNKTYYQGRIRNKAKTDEAMDDLYLDDVTVKTYKLYLQYLKDNNIDSNYLFPNISNKGNSVVLSDRAVRNMLKKYLEKTDINKHITPHQLRHSHAALLIFLEKDLEIIKTRLRHKDIRTTSNEYGHIYKEQKISVANDIGVFFSQNIEITNICDTQWDTQQ